MTGRSAEAAPLLATLHNTHHNDYHILQASQWHHDAFTAKYQPLKLNFPAFIFMYHQTVGGVLLNGVFCQRGGCLLREDTCLPPEGRVSSERRSIRAFIKPLIKM